MINIDIDLKDITTLIDVDLKDDVISVKEYVTPIVSDETLIYDNANVNEGVLEL